MRSVGLDLGARHIAYCEVKDGQVVERAAVRSLAERFIEFTLSKRGQDLLASDGLLEVF